MDDTKLLELAAAAIGHRIEGWIDEHGKSPAILDDDTIWQPLHENDVTDCMGDALRLAVKLGVKITPYPIFGHEKHSVIASRRWWAPPEDDDNTYVGPEVIEQYEDDPYAATRRAIVRAAAAIGASK